MERHRLDHKPLLAPSYHSSLRVIIDRPWSMGYARWSLCGQGRCELAARLRRERWSVDLLRDFADNHFRAPVEDALRTSRFFSLGFEDGPGAAFFYMPYHEAAKWHRAAPFSRDVMIADRFLDSIVAYQGHFLKSPESNDVAALEQRTA